MSHFTQPNREKDEQKREYMNERKQTNKPKTNSAEEHA